MNIARGFAATARARSVAPVPTCRVCGGRIGGQLAAGQLRHRLCASCLEYARRLGWVPAEQRLCA